MADFVGLTDRDEKAIKNAVDDIVWEGDSSADSFRHESVKWLKSHPFFSISTIIKYAYSYSSSKGIEHRIILDKLCSIQSSITDSCLYLSIQPLIKHHKKIMHAYMVFARIALNLDDYTL